MLNWIWNRIAFSLPAAWEMLQFSRDPEKGRCAFADRHRFRLELNWSAVPGEPDFERMMSDYAQKLERDGAMTAIRDVHMAGCPGLVGETAGGAASRYGKWLDAQHRLVELVFLWPEGREPELEKCVLASVRAAAPDADGMMTWRAFGMEVRVPGHFSLESCSAQTARAGLLFRGKTPAETWVFRRYGMVGSWLKTDLDAWLRAQVPEDIRDLDSPGATGSAPPRARLTGSYRPKGLLRKKGVFDAVAWQHPLDERLYLAMITNPRPSAYGGTDPDLYLKAAPEFTVIP